jgi:alkylhydroperoxidase family enzyme
LTQEQIEQLANYDSSAAYDELQKLVIAYAEELTRQVRVPESLVNQLKQRLSERELVELNLTVGLAQITNRFNEAFQIDVDF